MIPACTAIIADDEPLLRDQLAHLLAALWPELAIIGHARNGREAVNCFERLHPDVCFLDVHMPGLSGIEAAQRIGTRAHLVFVTAYDQYAVQAFDQGALDYLVKPVERVRLAETVRRVRQRVQSAQPALATEAMLNQLAVGLRTLLPHTPTPLQWIRAQVGQTLRLICVEDIDYIRADLKYTAILWRADGGQPAEALIRTPLKDLLEQLDTRQFVRIHRSYVVNLRAVSHIRRGDNETAELHLKDRRDVLPVSRSFHHVFTRM